MKKLLMVMLVLGSFSAFSMEYTTMAAGSNCDDRIVGKDIASDSAEIESTESQTVRD